VLLTGPVTTNGSDEEGPDIIAIHRRRRLGGGLVVAIVVGLAGFAILSKVGCVNMHTPPGHEGYVRSKPIFGAGSFVGTQKGPTSTGWVWRQEVLNVDMRPRTFSEEMSIVTAERLPLTFRAHARIRLREGSVKTVVETYGGGNWYGSNVRAQYQSVVRSKVQALHAFEVKEKSAEIAGAVLADMQARYASSPIEFLSIDIGDVQYPDVVVQSVIRKFVTNEDNERKDVELKIAQKQIDIGIEEAQGVSDSQKIIRTTLDPMFLQFEALNAVEQLAGTTNTTFVVVPFSRQGSAPIIMNVDR
jgi:hypothetical protein